MHVTRDGGAHWTDVTPPELTPWSKVTQIDAGHFDANTAYISVSRFRVDDLTPIVFRTHDGGATWTRIVNGLAPNASANVVREDPRVKGLLYAGTERDVYVSFDDGEHWRALTQNLPHTSVRDLIVHGDDLAIATHGRGFWIMDDIAALRETAMKGCGACDPAAVAQAFGPAHLFKPALAHRLRRNQNTDTPLPPEVPAGQNPPDGAIIDYYLDADTTAPVTLEIATASGTVIRRYASNDTPAPIDEKELAVPMYWVRQPRVLPATKGLHRWVWDLHYPAPDAFEHDYPISAIYRDTPRGPEGVLAVPGAYTVKLTVGGRTFTQPLTLKMDPRATITPLGLQQQFTLGTKIVDLMHRSFEAKLTDLNNDLATALDVVQGADRAPTTQATKAVADLERRLNSELAKRKP